MTHRYAGVTLRAEECHEVRRLLRFSGVRYAHLNYHGAAGGGVHAVSPALVFPPGPPFPRRPLQQGTPPGGKTHPRYGGKRLRWGQQHGRLCVQVAALRVHAATFTPPLRGRRSTTLAPCPQGLARWSGRHRLRRVSRLSARSGLARWRPSKEPPTAILMDAVIPTLREVGITVPV